MKRLRYHSIWPFTQEQVVINRCAMAELRESQRPKSKLLRVTTEYFEAVATWEKISGVWSCTQADTVIAWMKGQSPNQVAAALLKMGADYQFLDAPAIMGAAHGSQDECPRRGAL